MATKTMLSDPRKTLEQMVADMEAKYTHNQVACDKERLEREWAEAGRIEAGQSSNAEELYPVRFPREANGLIWHRPTARHAVETRRVFWVCVNAFNPTSIFLQSSRRSRLFCLKQNLEANLIGIGRTTYP
jgi:hypothetical protein